MASTLETLEVTKSSQESTRASISQTVATLQQELTEKEEYIKALEEKGQEVDRLFEVQERGHNLVQQTVLNLLKAPTDQQPDQDMPVEGEDEFVAEVRRALHAWHERAASESAKYQQAQAQNVQYLQSQREENDRLFAAQQQEIESLERKLGQSEQEVQTARQLLAESQQIVKQSIERPSAPDARDDDLVALRARVDQLTQENIELAQKVSKYHTQRNVILKQMKAMSDSAPQIAKENKAINSSSEIAKGRTVTFK